jgi:hypothetical protein
LEPGTTVTTLDGSQYRVVSKMASADGSTIKLADLQGRRVSAPTDFIPLSPPMAHFAAWARLVLAYHNSDFDIYVKEYIRSAGLPVDDRMHWSKWFYSEFAPRLHTKDMELRDEVIHNTIIQELAVRKCLANFDVKIRAFYKDNNYVRDLPREEQVTVFLKTRFSKRKQEANEYIKKMIFQEDTDPMMQMNEEGEEENILDTEDNVAVDEGYEMAEADADVAHFRKAFKKWLLKDNSAKTADHYVILFDLYWHQVSHDADDFRAIDLFDEWHERTGKSFATLRIFYAKLPKMIEEFLAHNKHELGDSNTFVRIMEGIKETRNKLERAKVRPPSKPKQHAHASVKKNAASIIVPARTPEDREVGGINEATCRHEFAYNGKQPIDGYYWFCQICLIPGVEQEQKAAASHTLPPGGDSGVLRTFDEYREREGIDLKAEQAEADLKKYLFDWAHKNQPQFTDQQLELIFKVFKGAAHRMGEAIGDSIIQKWRDKFGAAGEKLPCCGSITGYHRSNCPQYNDNLVKTLDALKAMPKRGTEEVVTEMSVPQAIESIISSGMFEYIDQPHFDPLGCDHCDNGLGTKVYDCKGRLSEDDDDLEFGLCVNCLNNLYSGQTKAAALPPEQEENPPQPPQQPNNGTPTTTQQSVVPQSVPPKRTVVPELPNAAYRMAPTPPAPMPYRASQTKEAEFLENLENDPLPTAENLDETHSFCPYCGECVTCNLRSCSRTANGVHGKGMPFDESRQYQKAHALELQTLFPSSQHDSKQNI